MVIQTHFLAHNNACRGGAGDGHGGFNQFPFITPQQQQLQQPWIIQSLCSDNNEIDQFILSQVIRQIKEEEEKEQEIQKARNKTTELQNLLEKLETDNTAWRKMVRESEAMVVSLNKKLEILREQAADAESCCEIEDEETRRKTTMVCKRCGSPSVCVLLLPCRHLCSCKDCEAFLDSCPVCTTEKKASIEVLIS
ncbi:hypothetical protein GQ457_01G000510 [Hibiscus cannabinus]